MSGRAEVLRRGTVAAAAAVVLLSVAPATAGWREVHRTDAYLDLESAREIALAAVDEDPTSHDAVAAAAWWYKNIGNLPDPLEIVRVAGDRPRDPELGFLLSRIEAPADWPPAGSLATCEIAGPFGMFEVLDLDRDVVPADRDLPPMGTPWRGLTSSYRLRIRTSSGTIGPPEAMSIGGVFRAAWTVLVGEDVDGWLVMEAQGGVNLFVDGQPVARLRACGQVDPGVTWYRADLEGGRHQIRVIMGSPQVPRVRISLYDDRGRPMDVQILEGDEGPWAESSVTRAEPPAAAALAARVAGREDVPGLLAAAALSEGRADPLQQRAWLEDARSAGPEDPWPHLALAWYFLSQPTGNDPQADLRRAREELRGCREIPAAQLVEHELASRERRDDDEERILYELVEQHGSDPRVAQLWVREAVRRGWYREAEEGVDALSDALPESRTVLQLRLATLGVLDRLEERRELVRSLLGEGVASLRLVEEFTSSCLVEDGVEAVERLRGRLDDPGLDATLIQFYLSRGEAQNARTELGRAIHRWGDLQIFDELMLVLEAEDPDKLQLALTDALARHPSDLRLRTLSWQRGTQPFFEPFRVGVESVVQGEGDPDKDVDVVLLLDQAVERIYADGSSLYYYHGVSRAITPVGARQAARLQPMPDGLWLNARVIKPDGREVVPADLAVREGAVELDDVRPGDIVEEEYVARVPANRAFRGGHLSPYVYRFADPERAFGLSEYLLLLPAEVDLNVAGNFAGLDYDEWRHDGLNAVRWRAEQMPPVPAEPFSPPDQELLPWVSYGFGVTWQNVGDAFRNRAIPMLRSSPELRRWAASYLEAADAETAVRDLVAAVVDEVEAGRAVLSFSSTAGESFSVRAGNRLGIVASVLADNGWDVDLVLARPRPLAGSNLDVPTLEAFSEPLLRTNLGEHEVWIDIEEQALGVNHIRPLLQGSDALVLPLTRPGQPVVLEDELPTFANPELEQRVKVEAEVEPSGDARVTLEMSIRGFEEERLRREVEGVPRERVEVVYRQMAVNLIPGATQVRGSLTPEDDGTALRLEMVVPGACEPDREDLVCRSLVLTRPIAPVLASLPQRHYPLVLELPLVRRHELLIEPPDGWRLDRPARRLDTRWGSVSEVLGEEAGRSRSVLTLEIPAQTVGRDEYPEFARFCQAVDELVSRPPRLQPDAS
jgi:hypothetical protein